MGTNDNRAVERITLDDLLAKGLSLSEALEAWAAQWGGEKALVERRRGMH